MITGIFEAYCKINYISMHDLFLDNAFLHSCTFILFSRIPKSRITNELIKNSRMNSEEEGEKDSISLTEESSIGDLVS